MSLNVKTFTTSYYKDEFLKIDTSVSDMLILSGKSEIKSGYIWVKINDGEGNLVKDYKIGTGADGSFYSSEYMDLWQGVYKINIFIGTQCYGYFSGYLPDVPYKREKSGGVILLPDLYIKNLWMYLASKNHSDEKCLKESYGVQCKDQRIIELAKSITARKSSQYDQVKAIHDWVAQNIAYDTVAYLNGTYRTSNQDALTTLNSKKAVCQGYSNLTVALLRAIGIKAGYLSGACLGFGAGKEWSQVDKGKVNHVWNEACADGRWIIMDVTWDSGQIGTDKAFHPKLSHSYFDMSVEMLSNGHLILSCSA